MIGPFINSGSIIIGGILGILLKSFIPKRVEEGLTPTFGIISLALGVTMVVRVQFLPAVVLATIFGKIVGDIVNLEHYTSKSAVFIQKNIQKIIPVKGNNIPENEFAHQFSTLIVLFSFSSLGIIGSLTEGLTGNYQYLIIKSILDFFTAMIFAITLGPSVVTIFVPQLALQTALFFLATVIMPYMTDTSYGDFSACGGIIMLALGFRMTNIKHFTVVNMLPALILIIPFSLLWGSFF